MREEKVEASNGESRTSRVSILVHEFSICECFFLLCAGLIAWRLQYVHEFID